jgi:hypothetical protein
MPFIEHFELLNLLHYNVVETWSARESGSGRKLLLHRYPAASGLRERLQSLPLEELSMLLKAGQDGDYFFVVTQDTPEFREFLKWVERTSELPPAMPVAEPEQKAAAEPGEFTRMFKGPATPPQRPVPTPPPPPPSAQEPGEFTRLFNSPQPPVAKLETPRTEVKPPAPILEPGEFTQMFGRINPNPPTSPPAAAPKATAEPGELTRLFKGPSVPPQRPARPPSGPQPSEFTKLFNNPLPETPLAARLEKPPPETKPAASFSEPGDFTKMFGRPERGAPAAPADDLGAATGIFSTKKTFDSATPQPPPAAGPSDYTRIFQQGSANSPAPAQTPPAPPKPTKSTPLALLIILAAIAVLAIALILYFVIKR